MEKIIQILLLISSAGSIPFNNDVICETFRSYYRYMYCDAGQTCCSWYRCCLNGNLVGIRKYRDIPNRGDPVVGIALGAFGMVSTLPFVCICILKCKTKTCKTKKNVVQTLHVRDAVECNSVQNSMGRDEQPPPFSQSESGAAGFNQGQGCQMDWVESTLPGMAPQYSGD